MYNYIDKFVGLFKKKESKSANLNSQISEDELKNYKDVTSEDKDKNKEYPSPH